MTPESRIRESEGRAAQQGVEADEACLTSELRSLTPGLAGPLEVRVTGGQPLHIDAFAHDGRGPELRRIHWNDTGSVPLAIDYINSASNGDGSVRHLRFFQPQLVMITPEEVIGLDALGDLVERHPGAAMFDRGRSSWLETFAETHLSSSRHYQMLFYDELVDVIAEGVEISQGEFHEAG